MSNLRVTFEPLWSLPVISLIMLAAILTVWWGYRLAGGIRGGQRNLLLGIRVLTLLVLLVGMLRPQLQWISSEGERSQIWVLADASRSMGVSDGASGITRRQSLLQLLESSDSQMASLKEEVDLKQFDFAEIMASREKFFDDAQGSQTALGSVLEEVVKSHQQQPLLSVFLLTDGAQRAVSPFDVDPRQSARELGELGVSLYTVPIGQAGSSLAGVDVAVTEIQVAPVVFEKKRVPVKVNVRWSGAAGQSLKVRLLLEDRRGLRQGQSGPLQPVPAGEFTSPEAVIETRYPSGNQVVDLSFIPEMAGEFKLAAQVEPVAGEVQTRNNTRETLVTVKKGGLRIAYFDIFRTEVKSVRQLNASEQIQVDFQLIRPRSFQGGAAVESRWFEPGLYDVFILGDVSAEQLGPEAVRLLSQRVREGAGLMMLGGYHTYSAGGYAETPLQELLPVQLNPGEKQAPGTFATSLQIQDELKLQPTSAGNRHYVTLIDTPERNRNAWEELPPLNGATRIRAKSDFVEILATSQTSDHLIVASETGRSRVMCLAFDQTYLWSQAGFDAAHRRFWRQAVLWLAHKDQESDQALWLTLAPKTIDPGGSVELEYGARDEQGNVMTDVRFRVSVQKPDGSSQNVQGASSPQGQLAQYAETIQPGDYFVSVEGERAGQAVSLPAISRFLVHDRDLELDYPIVDRGLLNELSQQAGLSSDSQTINPEDFQAFLVDYLQKKPWNREQNIVSTWNLWDGWPILILFVVLMTAEWLLRKRAGLV